MVFFSIYIAVAIFERWRYPLSPRYLLCLRRIFLLVVTFGREAARTGMIVCALKTL
jgi:hypothetical protein